MTRGEDDKRRKTRMTEFQNGPIGGFTFKDGHQSLIYQCGECGAYLEFNTGYNKHKKEKHGVKDNVRFGWADGEPDWQELDIKEEDIEVA
jgi:hypothetical protein